MQQQPKGFENYPAWIVLIANLMILTNYVIGAYILFNLGVLWGILFILYILYVEYSFYREGCRYCYYYGRVCAFGRGKIAPLIVKKGDPQKFCGKEIRFKDLIPQILVLVFTLGGGIILLIQRFSWLILGLMLVPLLIWFAGNPLLYGILVCPNCKQGFICCPAKDFFSGKAKKKKKQ